MGLAKARLGQTKLSEVPPAIETASKIVLVLDPVAKGATVLNRHHGQAASAPGQLRRPFLLGANIADSQIGAEVGRY